MKTEIIAITDRSRSMLEIQRATIDGFNAFLEAQREVPGEARMTHVLFNHLRTTLYQGIPLDQAPRLDVETYQPAGNTALYATLGATLDEQGKRIHEEAWADQVIVAILTDGEDNMGGRYSLDDLRTMIEHAQKHNWTFVFVGANIDAFSTAAGFGISAATTFQFTANAAGASQAYASIGATTRALRTQPADSTLTATLGGK